MLLLHSVLEIRWEGIISKSFPFLIKIHMKTYEVKHLEGEID